MPRIPPPPVGGIRGGIMVQILFSRILSTITHRPLMMCNVFQKKNSGKEEQKICCPHCSTSLTIRYGKYQRYCIISKLLHRNDEDGTLEDSLIQLASRTYRKPDGRTVSYSLETLRKWLYRYRNGGLPALQDAPRKNLGSHCSVSQVIENRLFELRKEHPR